MALLKTSGYIDRNNVYGPTTGLGSATKNARGLEIINSHGARLDFTVSKLSFDDFGPVTTIGFANPASSLTAPSFYAAIGFNRNQNQVQIGSFVSSSEYVVGDRYTILASGTEVRYYRNWTVNKPPFHIQVTPLPLPCVVHVQARKNCNFTQIYLGGLNTIVTIYSDAQQKEDNAGVLPSQIEFTIYQLSPFPSVGAGYKLIQTVPEVAAGLPAAPSALTATADAYNLATLTWVDNSSNELGFKIERKTGAGAFAEIATVGTNITSYADTSVAANTTYIYRVRAYNLTGNSAYTNEYSITTPPSPSALVMSDGFYLLRDDGGRLLI